MMQMHQVFRFQPYDSYDPAENAIIPFFVFVSARTCIYTCIATELSMYVFCTVHTIQSVNSDTKVDHIQYSTASIGT